MFPPSHPKWLAIGGVVLWALMMVSGWFWMSFYSLKAGTVRAPRKETSIPALIQTGGPVLMAALHPECTCSLATLDELERISRACGDKVRIVAIFADYDQFPSPVEESRLWRRAARIPDILILADHDGTMRRESGALTSGDCRLLDERGEILFRGGITAARGHSGPSTGGDAIITAVMTGNPSVGGTPVFGCPLEKEGTP